MANEGHRVVAAGVGGSGVVAAGTLIYRAGLRQYQYATRLPNYTSMMRGGPCECMIILSKDPIPSPLVSRGDVLLVLNNSQLKPFEGRVLPGGLILLESTGLTTKVEREDVSVLEIPALEIATCIGNPLTSNMVLLGAYVQKTGVFPPELMEREVEARFGIVETGVRASAKEALMAQNLDAFRRGVELAKAKPD
ncbi:2-oxoacid:acceptor oxidoreductase family protein [Chloroflexota bacterium]